ncbi:hypothetical protein LPJ81_000481 [Coemansia sp. IMI 209127]|nr:hypothetical protein LPJ81_000481 [Coemansia sp. IMI 209127]
MSYPQQSNFMFFGPDSGTNDNALAQAQAMSAGAYQHGHLGMASDGASAAAAAAAVAVAAGGNGGVNAYFVNNSHALMAAAAAGHAGMYPAGIVDTHQHQRSGSLSSATLAAAATGGAIGADHRRSPSGSLRSGANNAEHAQRRATHNAIERARRESLNGQFQDLASAVPALNSVRRPSKATIVEKSLEHIMSFRSKIEARDQCINRLQTRNLALHNEVNRLRSQLGLEPLDNDSEELLPETISEAPEDQLMASSSQNISTPAAARGALLQPHPASSNQHKRRQQSLDLGAISVASAGRPVLRVQTSNISKRKQQAAAAAAAAEATAQLSQAMLAPAAMATTVSAVGRDYYSSSSSGGASPMSSSASPLNISPLSAPILSRASASHFPFSTMQATSTAAVVAAAMQQQLFSNTMTQQQQHGVTTTAGGYAMVPLPATAASLGLIDMNNLSDVFAANNSADPAAGMISVSMPMSTSALVSNSSPGMTTLEGSPSVSMAQ